MEFGDSGSMATTSGWQTTAITVDLPVKATVISRQGPDWILHIERRDSLNDSRAYFRLTPASENKGDEQRELRIRDVVTVLEGEHVNLTKEILAEIPRNYEPHRHVLSYTLEEEQEPSFTELVAVAEVSDHHVVVVGTSFGMYNPGIYFRKDEDDLPVTVGQFMMVDCFPCLPGVRRFHRTHPYTEEKYHYYGQTSFGRRDNSDYIYIPGNMRNLTEEEIDWVKNRLRTKENVTEDEALIYIRDPHIAAYALEGYIEHNNALDVTFELPALNMFVPTMITTKGQSIVIQFILSADQYDRCITSDSQYNWRTSTDLTAQHEKLKSGQRMEPVYVRYHTSKIQKDGSYLVELLTEERSETLMQMVMGHPKQFIGHNWRVGPLCLQSDSVITAIKEGFIDFYRREETFHQFAGWTEKAENTEIPDMDAPFFVKGAPLDPHQLTFMKASAHIPGWTCAQAPPGCGKTHTTSALVAYLNDLKVKGGVCISGTTNAAVTNAADAVKDNFSDIHIVRNYSVKAEYDINEKSGAISLKKMAQNCDQYLDQETHQPVFNARTTYDNSVKKYENTKFDKLTVQANSHGRMLDSEKALKNTFIAHYEMNVYATTVELLIRGGDKFASGVVRGSEGYRDKAIKRIILDEAAQLSPTEALALYCRLPELTHITLLGDSYQLGPHSRIGRGSDVHEFKTEGELTRMYKLPSTIKKNLNGLYRCHPLISEKVLIPIYGDMMEPRVTAEQRNLAAQRGLPAAKDGSPVVFFHVQGKEEKCSNTLEATVVSDFIIDLVTMFGVEESDIVVLVFHRQQKIKLEDLLSTKKLIAWKSMVRVETVDSFQGKESKIVILCTTKSGGGGERAEAKLQFIAEPQRATVALSRAQHALYVFGDLVLLARSRFYAKIMGTLVSQDGFMGPSMQKMKEVDALQLRRTINKTLNELEKEKKKARKEAKEAKAAKIAERKEKKEKREKKMLKKKTKSSAVEESGAAAPATEDLPDLPDDSMEAADVPAEVMEKKEPDVVGDSLHEMDAAAVALLEEQLLSGNGTVQMEALEEQLINLEVVVKKSKEETDPVELEAKKENIEMPLVNENAGTTAPEKKRRVPKKTRQSQTVAAFMGSAVCPATLAGTAPSLAVPGAWSGSAPSAPKDTEPALSEGDLIEFD